MRRSSATWCVPALALLLSIPSLPADLAGQAVLGPQDDALVLPRGVFRVRVLNQWVRFNERYGMNTPGRPEGALEPLGIDFSLDTVGVVQFPAMAPVQAGLRQLTGIPDFTLSLGRTIVNSDVRITVTPVVLELGVTDRFSMGLVVPYVRTRNEILFNVNPEGREGTVGFNPAAAGVSAAQQQNAAVQQQFAAAAAALQNALDFCEANPSAGNCPQLNAQRANAQALIATSNAFAAGVGQIYGTGTGAGGSPFVPLAGTDAQLAIEARVVSFNSLYRSFLGQDIISAAPFAAQAQLGVADAQRILTEQPFGILADPLQTVERHGIGDIELGAKFLLFDSMRQRGQDRLEASGLNYRFSVGALARFGTGEPDTPENLVDVGTGQGQHDFELRGFADVLVGPRIFTSFIGRYGWQLGDTRELRISDEPSRSLTPAWRQQSVSRDLGDFLELEVNPRVILSEFFSVTGHYMYRRKAADQHTGTFEIDAATTGYGPVTLDASTLNMETEIREHRLGYGFSFSTVSAFSRERARLPVEVTYFHFQTTSGWGGNVPKLYSDQVQVRVYARLFGN